MVYQANVTVLANEDLEVKVGLGGAMNTSGEDTVIRKMEAGGWIEILKAGGGGAAQVIHGGPGYSG